MIDKSLYHTEIVRFLHTVSIKYDPFIEIMNRRYPDMVNENDITSYPYYINMSGEYHERDKKIYTNNNILISKSSLDNNEHIRLMYKNDLVSLYDLYKEYPRHNGIIKASIYPIRPSGIEELHKLPNMSLIGYDTSYLDSNERDSIVNFLHEYLTTIREEWFTNMYNNEDLFHTTFYSMIWNLLYMGIRTKRICNLRSDNVHNSHIISDLMSRGYKDCKLFSNRNITKFLYANTSYLDKKRGTNDNLLLIRDHILSKTGYDLYSYIARKRDSFIEHGKPVTHLYKTTLEGDIDKDSKITIDEFRNLLKLHNIIPDIDNILLDKQIESANSTNRFTDRYTKYLLMQQRNDIIRYEPLLYSMLFDITMQKYSENKYTVKYDFEIDIMNIDYDIPINKLDARDLFYLFNYCMLKYINKIPNELPTEYIGIQIADSSNINTTFYPFNVKDSIDNYVNSKDIVDRFNANTKDIISNKSDYYDMMKSIFNTYTELSIMSEDNYGERDKNAIHMLQRQLLTSGKISIPLMSDEITTYDKYFELRKDLSSILEDYERPEDYLLIANNIMLKILNLDNSFSNHVSTIDILTNIDCLFDILRRFTSYTVTFINQEGSTKHTMDIYDNSMLDIYGDINRTTFPYKTYEYNISTNSSIIIDTSIDVNIDMNILMDNEDMVLEREMDMLLDIPYSESNNRINTSMDVEIKGDE